MNNLRILLYMMLLSLAACHPEGTSVKQGLDKAAQLMAQDPDTASIILETIQSSQMNEAQLAEYNLLCTQLNEDKSIPHSSDKQECTKSLAGSVNCDKGCLTSIFSDMCTNAPVD